MNPQTRATCETYLHKPAAWTEPDPTGLIVGVCGCGRYVWQASDREAMSRAARRHLLLRTSGAA